MKGLLIHYKIKSKGWSEEIPCSGLFSDLIHFEHFKKIEETYGRIIFGETY